MKNYKKKNSWILSRMALCRLVHFLPKKKIQIEFSVTKNTKMLTKLFTCPLGTANNNNKVTIVINNIILEFSTATVVLTMTVNILCIIWLLLQLMWQDRGIFICILSTLSPSQPVHNNEVRPSTWTLSWLSDGAQQIFKSLSLHTYSL